MYFYDNISPQNTPRDAHYFFNVLIIDIAIRASLQKDSKNYIQEYFDLTKIASARPMIYHIYAEDDTSFKEGEKYIIELYPHAVIGISETHGIAFFDLFEEIEDEDEEGEMDIQELDNLEDLWRV